MRRETQRKSEFAVLHRNTETPFENRRRMQNNTFSVQGYSDSRCRCSTAQEYRQKVCACTCALRDQEGDALEWGKETHHYSKCDKHVRMQNIHHAALSVSILSALRSLHTKLPSFKLREHYLSAVMYSTYPSQVSEVHFPLQDAFQSISFFWLIRKERNKVPQDYWLIWKQINKLIKKKLFFLFICNLGNKFKCVSIHLSINLKLLYIHCASVSMGLHQDNSRANLMHTVLSQYKLSAYLWSELGISH